MSKVIAFSGGCFSGKTTAMQAVKKSLENAGCKVTVLDELIRTVTDKPIDVIRWDSSEYLELQDKIIRGKIAQEIKAFEDESDTIYLVDRAITDSLFYLQNYVDKSSLSSNEMKVFCELHKDTIQHARRAFQHARRAFGCPSDDSGYFAVVEFKPLVGKNTDLLRPMHIDYSKEFEHDAIHILNLSFRYSSSVPFKYVDLNESDVQNLVSSIHKFLKC